MRFLGRKWQKKNDGNGNGNRISRFWALMGRVPSNSDEFFGRFGLGGKADFSTGCSHKT
jgi:hypothetical protein